MPPPQERFDLAEQLRRSALGVVLDIAESTERRSARGAGYLLQVALGSLVEVVSCLRAILPPLIPHPPVNR